MKDNLNQLEIADETIEEKTFSFEKQKFKIELIKWFIGSVALVIVTIIVDRGFKERAAGIQEMQAFDRYVEIIMKADNIEERWKLSEYFAVVTPTERLRNRWLKYKESISADYAKFKELKDAEFNLKNKSFSEDSLTPTDIKLKEIQKQLAPLERSMTGNKASDAASFEAEGFSYLLNKDVENAIKSFRKSEDATNGFHAVYEIARYLSSNKTKLKDINSSFWKEAYKKIVTDYSWEMPSDVKDKLTEYSE